MDEGGQWLGQPGQLTASASSLCSLPGWPFAEDSVTSPARLPGLQVSDAKQPLPLPHALEGDVWFLDDSLREPPAHVLVWVSELVLASGLASPGEVR